MSLRFIFSLFSFTIFFMGMAYALYSFWKMRYGRMRARINKRLAVISGADLTTPLERTNVEVLSNNARLNALLLKVRVARYFHDCILKLNWSMRCDQFILLLILLVVIPAYILEKLDVPFLLVISISFIIAFLPIIIMWVKLGQRQAKLERQLPEILDFISRAMQAGHTFIGSLQLASSEAQEPIGSEFQRAFQEINFGRSVQHAMADLSTRINCAEMRYFAVAVFINQEIGGNLSSLIKGVASLTRERLKSKMILHALTSEARASAWILSALPFVVGLAMVLIRPEFVSVLWKEPAGRSMVGYGLVLMFFGIAWMQRMAKIRA